MPAKICIGFPSVTTNSGPVFQSLLYFSWRSPCSPTSRRTLSLTKQKAHNEHWASIAHTSWQYKIQWRIHDQQTATGRSEFPTARNPPTQRHGSIRQSEASKRRNEAHRFIINNACLLQTASHTFGGRASFSPTRAKDKTQRSPRFITANNA